LQILISRSNEIIPDSSAQFDSSSCFCFASSCDHIRPSQSRSPAVLFPAKDSAGPTCTSAAYSHASASIPCPTTTHLVGLLHVLLLLFLRRLILFRVRSLSPVDLLSYFARTDHPDSPHRESLSVDSRIQDCDRPAANVPPACLIQATLCRPRRPCPAPFLVLAWPLSSEPPDPAYTSRLLHFTSLRLSCSLHLPRGTPVFYNHY